MVLVDYSPWLIVVLLGMLTVTSRSSSAASGAAARLVDIREAATNVARGPRRRLDRERGDGARVRARDRTRRAIHARTSTTHGEDAALLGLPEPAGRLVTSPIYVLTNTRASSSRSRSSRGSGAMEAVFLTFSYFAQSTRVMWEFNRIYRNLEGALTDAAQFAELLLDPPAVDRRGAGEPFAPRDFGVELRDIRFPYSRRGRCCSTA